MNRSKRKHEKPSKHRNNIKLSSWLYIVIPLIGILLITLFPQRSLNQKTLAYDYFRKLMDSFIPIPHKSTIQLGSFTPITNTPTHPPRPTNPPHTPRPTAIPVPTYTPEQTCGIIAPTNAWTTIIPTGNQGGCCIKDGYKGQGQCCSGVPQTNMPTIGPWCNAKPVIYLYPQKPMFVDVTLNIPGAITISDPPYHQKEGWKNILALPGGTLKINSKSYHELFYESAINYHQAPKGGIVTPSEDLRSALAQLISRLGLNNKEKEEFFSYWLPKLSSLKAPYFLISVFPYEQKVLFDQVIISPKPDTFIEVIMYFKPLSQNIDTPPLLLPEKPERKGFTVVEWGGILDN